MKPWLSPASTPLDPISSSRWSMAGQLQFAATVPQFSVEVVSHRRNGPPLQFDVLVCKECGYVLPRWSQSIQFPPVHVVSSVFAIGADAHGVKSGVVAPSSMTMSLPGGSAPTDGPPAEPHQLQRASSGVSIFGATRSPACAFPSMSLNRTIGLTGGKSALRLPIHIAAGLRGAGGVAQGCTTPRIRLCSMRPDAKAWLMAVGGRPDPPGFPDALATSVTPPVAVTGSRGHPPAET